MRQFKSLAPFQVCLKYFSMCASEILLSNYYCMHNYKLLILCVQDFLDVLMNYNTPELSQFELICMNKKDDIYNVFRHILRSKYKPGPSPEEVCCCTIGWDEKQFTADGVRVYFVELSPFLSLFPISV